MKRSTAVKALSEYMVVKLEQCFDSADEDGYGRFNCGELLDFMVNELDLTPPKGKWDSETKRRPKADNGMC